MVKINLISYEEFEALNLKKQYQYVEEIWGLSNFNIIGEITHFKDNNFLFIKNLINPITGLNIGNNLFYDQKDSIDIYCYIPEEHDVENIKLDGETVITRLKINKKSRLREDKIFYCEYLSINSIQKNNLIDQINKLGGYKLLGLIEPADNNIGNVIKELNHIYQSNIEDNLNLKMEEYKNQVKTFKKIKKEESEKLHKREENINIKEDKLKKEIKSIEEVKVRLNELGFTFDSTLVENESKDKTLNKESLANIDNLIDFIHKQLQIAGFVYPKDLIRQFILSLNTEEMIILSGPSGTGKTSLINELAKILNFKCEIIPVQPSWTDKEDLLGFYNPIRKEYIPTRFLDFIIDALNDPNHVYILCLDEMNLSQIEYYLADILSIKEISDGEITLYSDYEYRNIMNEAKHYIQYIESDKIKKTRINNIDDIWSFNKAQNIISSYNNIQRYPSKIKFPNNLRIVGTMNVDGDVRSLSPKVIDRSFIIPMDNIVRDALNLDGGNIQSYVEIKPSDFKAPSINYYLDLEDSDNSIDTLVKYFEGLNIQFNHRFIKHYKLYSHISKEHNIDFIEIIDDFILLKLLPNINIYNDDIDDIDNILRFLEENNFLNSQTKLLSMIENSKQLGILTFWS